MSIEEALSLSREAKAPRASRPPAPSSSLAGGRYSLEGSLHGGGSLTSSLTEHHAQVSGAAAVLLPVSYGSTY